MKIPSKEELKRLYLEKGLTLRELSKHIGKGQGFTRELLNEYKIKIKPKNKYDSIEHAIEVQLNKFKNKDVRKHVKQWLDEKSLSSGYTRGHYSRLCAMQKYLDAFRKPLKEVIDKNDKEELIRVLNLKRGGSGQRLAEVHKYRYELVSFFTWLNNGKKPDVCDIVKRTKTLDEERKSRQYPSLTEDDMIKILDSCENSRDKTMFSIMVEIPVRSIEMRNLNVGDVQVNEFGYILNLGSKTKSGFRRIMLIHSAPQLREFLQNHRFKDEPNKPLFYNAKSGKRLDYFSMNYILKTIVKRSGLNKDVCLHDFRKFSTTQKLKDSNFNVEEIRVLGGWSNINQLDTYSKLRDDDVNEKLLIASGKKQMKEKQESKLKPIECPRCSETNSRDSLSCSKCWLPLKQDKRDEIKVTEQELSEQLTEEFRNPEFAMKFSSFFKDYLDKKN